MTVKHKDIKILDVTIRDGSYAINYQYTPRQIAAIVQALDAAGIDYVEVSHGCGLGAGRNLGLAARADDADYVAAARSSAHRIKIGVIAGAPPVTLPADIDSVIDDVDFIRFAANCDKPLSVAGNIAHALKLKPNLEVFMQLMRSSRRDKGAILEAAKAAADLGVKLLYLVDTAGHYMPEEVADIVTELSEKSGIETGFHGHNNLGLAIANSLAAVKAGAVSVDASLKGMGRAGGNAQLDALVSALKRMGLAKCVDLLRLIRAGEEHVDPIMPPSRGIASIDVLTAHANIDLYPPELYMRIAEKAGVGFIDFVRELASDAELVEPGYHDIERALTKMGADAGKTIAAVGLKRRT